MSLRDLDWHYLREGLTRSFLLLFVGAILWGGSIAYRTQLTNTLNAERQSLAGLEQERRDLTSRRDARRQYAAIYAQLQSDGVVGGDQRLIWVQNTRDAAAALSFPYLRYTTSPQQSFEAPWLVPGASAPVTVSMMELQMGLVHEQDLLRLFARLGESPGLFQVQSCALERLGQDVAPEPDRANVTGTCQLAWYSLPKATTLASAGLEN